MKIVEEKNGCTHYIPETRAEEQEMVARSFLENLLKSMRSEEKGYKWLYEIQYSDVAIKYATGFTAEDRCEIGRMIEAGLVRMVRKWAPDFPTYDQVERMHREFDELREACKGMSEKERRQKYDALNEKWDSIKANEEL